MDAGVKTKKPVGQVERTRRGDPPGKSVSSSDHTEANRLSLHLPEVQA